MSTNLALRPNRIPWPPLIYLGAAVAALILGGLWPFDPKFINDHRNVFLVSGIGFMFAGAALDLSAMLTMRRHRVNILPHRAATALLTTGPFAWSRNPIYLGNTLMLAGAAPTIGNPWFLLLALVAAALVTALAIRREEQHLTILFGPAWLAYAERTPRWLGRR